MCLSLSRAYGLGPRTPRTRPSRGEDLRVLNNGYTFMWETMEAYIKLKFMAGYLSLPKIYLIQEEEDM